MSRGVLLPCAMPSQRTNEDQPKVAVTSSASCIQNDQFKLIWSKKDHTLFEALLRRAIWPDLI